MGKYVLSAELTSTRPLTRARPAAPQAVATSVCAAVPDGTMLDKLGKRPREEEEDTLEAAVGGGGSLPEAEEGAEQVQAVSLDAMINGAYQGEEQQGANRQGARCRVVWRASRHPTRAPHAPSALRESLAKVDAEAVTALNSVFDVNLPALAEQLKQSASDELAGMRARVEAVKASTIAAANDLP